MSKILVERSHALGLEQARTKAEHLVQKISSKYGLEHKWDGDSVALNGKGAKGRLDVAEDLVRIAIELSFFLSPMSGAIQSEIERILDRELAA